MNIVNPTNEITEKVITSRHIVTLKKMKFQLAKLYAINPPNTKRMAPIIMIVKKAFGFIPYALSFYSLC